jgi:general secretion pathway protein K
MRAMKSVPLGRGQDAQQGVALGIVVWFIAGMALLVSGIVSEARIDARMAQLHYFKAQAAAAGDGAIHLALAEQEGRRAAGQVGTERLQNYQLGSKIVEVRMIPGGMFVNLSTANLEALQELFALGALKTQQDSGFVGGSAAGLARAVVDSRDGLGGQRRVRFHSPEDLLRVPGVSRQVYDGVRDYITVESLSGGFKSGVDFTEIGLEQLDEAMSGKGVLLQDEAQHAAESLRVDAIVEIGDQQWLRRRWATLDEGGYSSLPWRFVRTEAARPLATRGVALGR